MNQAPPLWFQDRAIISGNLQSFVVTINHFIQQLPASPTFSEFSLHNYSSNFHLGKELFLLLLFVHSCLQSKNLDYKTRDSREQQ